MRRARLRASCAACRAGARQHLNCTCPVVRHGLGQPGAGRLGNQPWALRSASPRSFYHAKVRRLNRFGVQITRAVGMQGKERTAIEISSASPAVLSPISVAAKTKVYGGGRLPPGFSFDENGELVHAPARESRSDFYLGRMTKTTSSASTRSRPDSTPRSTLRPKVSPRRCR